MIKTTRLLLVMLLVFSCVMGMIPVQAEEIDYTCGDNLTWSIDVNTKTLTISGTGKMHDYTLSGNNTAPWKKYSTSVETLIVEDGVTNIGEYAFCYCSALKTASVGEGVQTIGKFAFYYCTALRTIQLPFTLKTIAQQALCYTNNLRTISFPNGCGLMYVSHLLFRSGSSTITSKWYDMQPDGCVYIGDLLFAYKGTMPENTTLHVREGTRVIQADFRNMIDLVDLDIPDSVFSIGYSTGERYGIFDGTTWFNNAQQTTQGMIYAGKVAYRFGGQMQFEQEIVLEDGTRGIASCAFQSEQLLVKLILPDSLICIQWNGIWNCRNLHELDISHVQFMYAYAWNSLPIETLTIPASLRWAQADAFSVGSETKQIIFEDQACMTELSSILVYGTSSVMNVEYIQLADNLQRLGENSFYDLGSLKTILIPPSVQSIERGFVRTSEKEIKPTIQCYSGSYAHTWAIENEYPFELLDYTALDTDTLNEQLEAAKAIQRDLYTAQSLEALDEAVAAVRLGAQTTQQTVDAWTAAIRKAITQLAYKPADYAAVQAKIENAQALDRSLYTQESLQTLDDAIAAVDWTLTIERQVEVDAFANTIADAIRNIAFRPADYSAVNAAVQAARETERILYSESSLAALDMAVDAVVYDLDITRQAEVDGFAAQIRFAIESLSYCSVVLRNEPHGVLVSATAKELHPETLLAVDEIDPSVFEIADFAVGGHVKSVRYYDITLLRQTKIVQPNGTVEVKIRIADGVDPVKCRVYHVTEDLVDPLVRVASSLDGNYIVFQADHFSEYAVVEVETVLDRIEVTALPQKTQYALGEVFVPNGLQVTAYFSDGRQQTIENYDISAVNTLSVGEKTITVYYTFNGLTKSDHFTIRVSAESLTAQILCDGSAAQSINRRVSLFRPYAKETLSLHCSVSTDAAVTIEWSSDNEKVQIDQNGHVTNKGWFGARKAIITATVKDSAGNVLARTQMALRFFKFNFQRNRLQTQSVVYLPKESFFFFI